MARPILHGSTQTTAHLSVTSAPARTSGLSAHELARRLREPRTRAYVERMGRLDVGTLHDISAVRQLLEEIRGEFPELGLEELPLGWVSRCYLGEPFEVHVLDAAGSIVQHYRRGELLPAELERARSLALHPAYAFIEVHRDARQKQLQLAETRLVKVRQEIEERFGFYGEVRRRATGIVQALDAGIVTHQSVQDATEEMMISAPGYWLAPALVALAAWIRDERILADKAVSEAVRRDEYKTSLYFALVLRRYDRRGAAAAWLGRFYAHQDPTALDREFVVLLDAVAGGIFGPEARSITRQHTVEWLNDLAQKPGFVPEQERRWAVALSGLTTTTLQTAYPTLERYSPTWPVYRSSLLSGHLHARVRDYFSDIFDGELAPSPRLRDEVDKLLARLVTEYDDDELPLRETQREMQLIVDENGDVSAARQRMDAEKQAFEQTSDFTQLLTNAAMHPESSGATRGTQRYAVALSRDWVVAAYDAVTASARAAVPDTLALKVDEWQGVIRDGSEEQSLVAALGSFLETKEREELQQANRSIGAWIAIGLGIVLGGYGLVGGFGFLLVVIGIALVLFGISSRRSAENAKAQIRGRYATARTEGGRIVKAAVAEAVDARAELMREDARAEETRAVLLAISPDQYTLSREAEPRAVLA